MVEASGWAADEATLAEFLPEPNLARIGTVDAVGEVHVVPVWFARDGEHFLVGAQAGDPKVENVRRTGRASIEIAGDLRRKRGILARGDATLTEGEEGRAAYARVAEAQLHRYQPARPPMETAARMADRGTPVVVTIVPRSIVSWGR